MYLRKSRNDVDAEHLGDIDALARHERILRDLAMRMHVTIAAAYREIVSGDSIAGRPEMQRLLHDVEAGAWDGVFVVETERLARGDSIDQGIVLQAFKYSGTKIITPVKIYDPDNEFDEEYFEFSLFMSRREYKTINRRLIAGKDAAAREGKFVGSVPPYGWRIQKLTGEKGSILSPDPAESQTVQLIFDRYLAGDGLTYIATLLDGLGIPTRKGGRWSPATVREILQNPVHCGQLLHNRRKQKKIRRDGKTIYTKPRTPECAELFDGRHDGIVTRESFERVNQILSSRSIPHIREDKALCNPFAGLLVCGACGRKMVRKRNRNAQDSILCPNHYCHNCSAILSAVENRVRSALVFWLSDRQIVNSVLTPEDPAVPLRISIDHLQTSIARVQSEQYKLCDLLERGVYSDDLFRARNAIKEQELMDLKHRLQQATEQLSICEERERMTARVVPVVETLLEKYDRLSPAEKNDLLRQVITRIEYRRDSSGRWSDPDNFTLDIYWSVPRKQ